MQIIATSEDFEIVSIRHKVLSYFIYLLGLLRLPTSLTENYVTVDLVPCKVFEVTLVPD